MQQDYTSVIPDSIEMRWDDESLVYREMRKVDDEGRSKSMLLSTANMIEGYSGMFDDIDGVEVDFDYRVVDYSDETGEVGVEVVFKPGHPNGSRSIIGAAIATEMMTLVGFSSGTMWRTIVETTAKTIDDDMDVEFLVDK